LYTVSGCVVKILLDLLKGLQSYGGFKLMMSGFWQHPVAVKLCSMPSLVGLGFHLPLGQSKTLSFLFVCLSVTLIGTFAAYTRWRRLFYVNFTIYFH